MALKADIVISIGIAVEDGSAFEASSTLFSAPGGAQSAKTLFNSAREWTIRSTISANHFEVSAALEEAK